MKNKPYPLYDISPINDLKEMVKKRAKETPEAIAFSYSKGKDDVVNKTCAEFSDEIDAFGTYLYSLGLKGKHIAILGENSYMWLMAFFAIVNGGMVAVPIDKDQQSKTIQELLVKSDCSTLIYSHSYQKTVQQIEGVTKLSMTDFCNYINIGVNIINCGNRDYINYEINPEMMSVIAFTSGTTGFSKGVMLSQKNIVADMNNGCRNFVLEGNVIAVLPFHHMFGLVVGTLMVFNYRQNIFICSSLKKLPTELKKSAPQTAFFVPLFVETFYKQIWNTARLEGKEKKLKTMMKISDLILSFGIDLRKKFFSQVRDAFGGKLEYILCGGAALDEKYIKAFRSWGVEILNAYGITECSPGIAVNRNYHHKDNSVGLAIPNCEIKTNDENEIFVRGDNVMLGYYNDEQSTSEVFSNGWYITGDLGYVDKDGFLFITGRKKNLIILSNGENVSPEEIENRLLLFDEIREVVVYSDCGIITAEIFPDEEYMSEQEHFNELVKTANREQPSYKQINKVKLRTVEFEKNSTKKILRHKIMEVNNDRQD